MQKDTQKSKVSFDEELPCISLGEVSMSDPCLPDPELYNFYKALINRTIYIDRDITSEFLMEVTKIIIEINREDRAKGLTKEQRKPIRLLIFSYGGDLDATLSFMEICKISETPIYTYNIGTALSAGFYILIMGHKRFALRNSQCLVHYGSGGVSGTYEQVQSQTKQYKQKIKKCEEILLAQTQIPQNKYKQNKDKEWYINDVEQKEFGIVDKVIEGMEAFFEEE